MAMLDALLAWLPRFFNRDPLPFLAFRLRHNGEPENPITGDSILVTIDTTGVSGDGGVAQFSATWQVQDGTLTARKVELGTVTATFTYELAGHTLSTLTAALAADGFEAVVTASPEQALLSALILLDGAGSTEESNGDALFAWTSLLFAYLQPIAAELDAAKDQIAQMLLQMETQTAETEWLDFIGSYYAVPRTLSPVPNLLLFSEDLSQAPTPWTLAQATAARSAAGAWFLRGTTASAEHTLAQTLTPLDTPFTYTATWRFRPAGYTRFRAKIADGGGTNGAFANFDGVTGTATPSNGGTGIAYSASMTAEEDGWWRCRITGLPAATGTTVRLVIYLTDGAYGTTFAADPLLGIELAEFQLERGDAASPYLASGGLIPEDDRAYGRRIITEVLRPRSNNLAIAAAVLEATGQPTTIEDVILYGSPTPSYNAGNTHNSAVLHNATAAPIYGLFDATTAYDLLGAEPPTLYIERVRDLVDRLRSAGTHLRALTLSGGVLDDAAAGPSGEEFSNITVAPTLTDTAAAPAEVAGETIAAVSYGALTDTAATGSDTAGLVLTITYGTLYDAFRLHNGAVVHAGGVLVEAAA